MPPSPRHHATRTPLKSRSSGARNRAPSSAIDERTARVGPGDRAQEQRDVGDRARHRTRHGERRPGPTPLGTRPGDGRKPTTLQNAAGLRSEPPVSLPSAIGTIPHASATAAPPLLPPQVFVRSYGLRVAPKTVLNVCEPAPNSGVLVLPQVMRAGGANARDDQRVARRHVVAIERRPARRADAGGVDQILVRDGQAVQRAERPPARRRSSARAASAIARSATSVTMALTLGLTRSIRARCAA